ncbi:MAG: UDP-2,3-diacylglucosamine diphosphatase LpxI [Rhodospirillales bacterium]|nr:UDP-2,3-diacylglucosamine diphosphatase LpxI [Alphaproteobacteria bacterium]USO03307.1 MAG: UDP-2,3-diacylglucosamine diphosphatase LpxI [Rhodospirillales bacterium]
MSAGKQRPGITPPRIEKLGIIAGSGDLPLKLVLSCEAQGISPFIVAIEGHADPSLYAGRDHIVSRPGAAGYIVKTLKERGIKDLIMIGAVKRPRLAAIRPDLFTARFLARLGVRALGDSDFLSAIRAGLEEEGFTVHAVQDFMYEDILMPKGVLGKYKPSGQDLLDIAYGMEVSQAIGEMDIGQAAIVFEGRVLGVEGAEGTNGLIKRCGAYKEGRKGGVLVKTCKPQQDKALDLPTIGAETLRLCVQSKIDGIAVQAGSAFLLDAEAVREIANTNGLFVVGLPEDLKFEDA